MKQVLREVSTGTIGSLLAAALIDRLGFFRYLFGVGLVDGLGPLLAKPIALWQAAIVVLAALLLGAAVARRSSVAALVAPQDTWVLPREDDRALEVLLEENRWLPLSDLRTRLRMAEPDLQLMLHRLEDGNYISVEGNALPKVTLLDAGMSYLSHKRGKAHRE